MTAPPESRAYGGWRPLSGEALGHLARTRLELHYAVQLLASFGQALVTPRADDSHRSMTWDDKLGAFRSEPSAEGVRAVLRVPALTLDVWRGGEPVLALRLRGRTPGEVRRWLAHALEDGARGVPALTWPEYDLPSRPGGWDAPFEPEPEALEILAAWYGNAASVLGPVARATEGASPVRCWPHHFDLATLLALPDTAGRGEARYVGLGLSPGDDSLDKPYYYVNGWPPPARERLPALPGPGAWHTEGWVGAVLEAEDIVSVSDPDQQRDRVVAFLADATAAMRIAGPGT